MSKLDYKNLMKTLGHDFKNISLLTQALTHKSLNTVENNQRLEFLGDTILSFIISTKIFAMYPQEGEGNLSKRKASIIKGSTLAIIAKSLGLSQYLFYNKEGISCITQSMLEDCLEAVIGAIYLDSDIHSTILSVWPWFEQLVSSSEDIIAHPKAALQEKVQSLYKVHPVYTLTEHDQTNNLYHIELNLGFQGSKILSAAGKCRKEVEILLARQALAEL